MGGSLCSNSGFATASNLSCASTTTVNNYTYSVEQWSNHPNGNRLYQRERIRSPLPMPMDASSTNSIGVTEPSALVLTPSQTNVLLAMAKVRAVPRHQ
nr:hypothetical protein [Bacteroidota bacterium]